MYDLDLQSDLYPHVNFNIMYFVLLMQRMHQEIKVKITSLEYKKAYMAYKSRLNIIVVVVKSLPRVKIKVSLQMPKS